MIEGVIYLTSSIMCIAGGYVTEEKSHEDQELRTFETQHSNVRILGVYKFGSTW